MAFADTPAYFGIGALALTGGLFEVIRWAGIGYLLWLGIRMFRAPDSQTGRDRRIVSGAAAFRTAVVVQIANPKELIFFIAIFPPFVDPDRNVALQVLILGATSQVIEMAVLLGYAALGSRALQAVSGGRWAESVDRPAGAMLVLVAFLVAALAAGRLG